MIDSYAWIEYFKGSEEGKRAKRYTEKGNCVTPTIVLAELSDKYHREGWKYWEEEVHSWILDNKIERSYTLCTATKYLLTVSKDEKGRRKNKGRSADGGIQDVHQECRGFA